MIGQTLGNYRITHKLGAGGQGTVYKAIDHKLGRTVVIKVLPAELNVKETNRKRFEREARLASALDHPNICTIFDLNEANGVHFIAMQYVEGRNVRQFVKGRPLEMESALRIAIQVADALSAAHARGIIHRDIKSGNVMVTDSGQVKILDFGLAKLLDEAQAGTGIHQTELTEVGIPYGTATYAAPEQARGDRVDARADIFSTGVLLYEMLTGTWPFQGRTAFDVRHAVIYEKPKSLAEARPGPIPSRLQQILDCTLAKEPRDRYQKISELRDDLRKVLQEISIGAQLEVTAAPRHLGGANPVSRAMHWLKSLKGAETPAKSPQLTVESARTTSSAEYLVTEMKVHKRGLVLMLAALVLALASAIYFLYFAQRAGPIDSIAVLPLVNVNNGPNTEYLSDGITESIISNLSQLPQLKVMARSTVFRFKGKDIDAQKVGHDLNVRAVLTGRLLQQGESLVIRAELVNVADGAQLWGAEYNRKLSDVLAVQQDISREISDNLRLKLTSEEKKRLTGRDTANAEAYQFYLRGRYYWNKRTAENIRKAIEQFQQAADKDPNYALAYVGLADCYLILDEYAGVPASETTPKAKAFAERARELDSSLAEAHTSLAFAYSMLWQWDEAEKEFKRSIELNPNYPTTHHWYGLYLRNVGRLDEAMLESKRALELDPLSLIINANVAETYRAKGDTTSAIEQCMKIIELDPGSPLGHEYLGLVFLKQQHYSEAIAELQKAIQLSGRASEPLGELGYAYAISGRRLEALTTLKELEQKYATHAAAGRYLAAVHAGMGDKDQAFAWLEKNFQARGSWADDIRWRPQFESLHSDPRYADLLRRMGLQP